MKYLKAAFWATFWAVAIIGGVSLFIVISEYVILTFGGGIFGVGLVAIFIFAIVFSAIISPDTNAHRPPLR